MMVGIWRSAAVSSTRRRFSIPLACQKIRENRHDEAIFAQGDRCENVMYIQHGGVKLSVLSKTGREAIVAMLGPGDFFGEGCLAGQPVRIGSASAITPTTVLLIGKKQMTDVLHKE